MIINVKYPVRVPTSQNDEYEQKCNELTIAYSRRSKPKNVFKYVWNEEEFSMNHLPNLWRKVCTKLIQIINGKEDEEDEEEIEVVLPQAMPLSCQLTHLHRFENIEMLSEPKVIFMNQIWYK
jgi:hypothetical protein